MRSLALAGIVAVLAGCSLPYVDTSFKAVPKPTSMAEGEHHETNDRGPTEGASGPDTTSTATAAYAPDRDDASLGNSVAEGGKEKPTGRTNAVFPPTAPPAGG